jgi:hypothetical protein
MRREKREAEPEQSQLPHRRNQYSARIHVKRLKDIMEATVCRETRGVRKESATPLTESVPW